MESRRTPFPELAKIVAWRDGQAKVPDVLVFGDSVMERVARQDDDRRNLGKMISMGLKQGLSCEVFSFSAYHSEVFAAMLAAVERLEIHPRCIVVPINLRSFSPQWNLNPEFRFAEEISLAKRFATSDLDAAPMVSRSPDGKHLPASSADMRRYRDAAVDFPGTPYRKVGDFLGLIAKSPLRENETARRKQAIFMFHYMNALDEGHDKLKALLAAAETALGMGAGLVLYVTPINHEAGLQFAGAEFCARVDRNVGMIKELAEKLAGNRRVKFLDLSRALGRTMFFDDDTATEHLNQSGRQHVSSEVCSAVNQMLFGETKRFASRG